MSIFHQDITRTQEVAFTTRAVRDSTAPETALSMVAPPGTTPQRVLAAPLAASVAPRGATVQARQTPLLVPPVGIPQQERESVRAAPRVSIQVLGLWVALLAPRGATARAPHLR